MDRMIISCFGSTNGSGLRCSRHSSVLFVREHRSHLDENVDWLDAKLHHEQCGKRFLDVGEMLFTFWIDSFNNANKVGR
jgi:hypothetical protein